MFKKTERLSRAKFDEHFKKGKRVHHPQVTIVYSPFPTLHVSVVVGKKVSKKSPERNKFRRRIYHLVKQQLLGKTGVYIILLKPTAKVLTKQQTKDLFTTLFKNNF